MLRVLASPLALSTSCVSQCAPSLRTAVEVKCVTRGYALNSAQFSMSVTKSKIELFLVKNHFTLHVYIVTSRWTKPIKISINRPIHHFSGYSFCISSYHLMSTNINFLGRSHPVICERHMCYFVFFFISSISCVSHLPIRWTTPFHRIAIVKDETLNTYLRMRYSLICWPVHTYDTSLQTCILMWHRSIWDCMPFPFVQSKDR